MIMYKLRQILNKTNLLRDDIIFLLNLNRNEAQSLFKKSEQIKLKNTGKKVFFRGIIEFSNICIKDCLYCGIRRSNKNIDRYELSEDTILDAAKYAFENNFGSIVLQSGERTDRTFVVKITNILKKIKKLSNQKLGITLSLGEQTEDVYKQWFDAGAHRYLLRIEEANPILYEKIHPKNKLHSYQKRLNALKKLQKIGYQTGTGIMIGLPFQTIENIADDLLFFKNFDIDMIGMGPYIEHNQTPLYQYRKQLWTLDERFFVSLKTIAVLRLLMPDINIAATTALQAIDPIGREKAVRIGANVIMPNISPTMVRKDYLLYENKPCTNDNSDDCLNCLKTRLQLAGAEFAPDEWGDSIHFFKRIKKNSLKI
jgi:biotin synthase